MSRRAASLLKAVMACAVVAAMPAAVSVRAQDAPADGAARVALGEFGKCVAMAEPGESARVIGMDFTSARYRTALRLLADEARDDCARDAVGNGNALRSANLLMAGAIAEGLLAGSGEPLNARLLRAAQASVPTYSPTDAISQCLARSLPDDAARLFRAAPASPQEAEAATALQAAVPACTRAAGVGQRMDASVAALRAMLATATFRLLHAMEGANG